MQNLSRTYDFKALEEKYLAKWKNEKIIEEAVKRDESKPLFSFLEGPPTANAPPALHHAEARIFKDVENRYQFMLGKSVPRKGGWDTHGLPVEVQVEKKLGLKNKKEIETYGIEKFVTECKKDVITFIGEWKKFTERLGFWVDLENAYETKSNNYIESVWWSLKELFSKGYLYEGHKTVPFCPRCQTSLSSHEVALGYQTVKDPTATIKFQSTKKQNRYFLAWTTTPWTLPGNMALAVHPELDYAIVENEGKEYVLANELVTKHFSEKPKIISVVKGKELVNEKYVPLFDFYVNKNLKGKQYLVLAGEFVTIMEGTGIVHIAPGFGEDDYTMGKEQGIAFVQHVKEDGTFNEEMGKWSGKNIFKLNNEIILALKEKNLVFNEYKYEHEYPFCWRCDSPLIYYAMKSWFINMSEHREKLIQHNEEIEWIPSHIKEGRFGEWITNVKDWGLSRKRYWGTPLPIWRCEKCKHIEVIGSIAELRAKGKNVPNENELELHKPFVDKITVKCEKCGNEMTRESDVIDVWYDSGAASFAQFHYPFENKELFEKSFPYDYIAEAIDQTRGWFYTLHALATLLFDKPAYKRVVVAGLLVDKNGEKMSKSKGNVINPWEVFEKHGVDAARLYMCLTHPGDVKRVSLDSFNETIRTFFTILWNSLLFAQPLLEKGKKAKNPLLAVEDQWILSRLAHVREEVTLGLETCEFQLATRALIGFVNEDVSRTYIKLVRERVKEEGNEGVAFVFYQIFSTLSILLAPFIPYISEAIYEATNGKEKSVHFAHWLEKRKRNEELEKRMELGKEIITLGLALREKAKIPMRWPLSCVNVHTQNKEVVETISELQELLQLQLNVKKITCNQKAFELQEEFGRESKSVVSLDINITPELEGEGFARELSRKIQGLRKEAKLNPLQTIAVNVRTSLRVQELLEKHVNEIKEKVRAEKMEFVSAWDVKPLYFNEERVKNELLEVGIIPR